MQTTRELITRRGVERYEQYEQYEQYRLFEEKTDIGERLSLPIENHLELEVVDGHVFGRDIEGQPRRMVEWSREAYENALHDPGFSGANAVERTRRKHEYDEAVAVEDLRAGEVMVVFSPIPDVALAGQTTIQGYRTDLARTFCRVYSREDKVVHSITLTLEQSNKQALRTAANAIGMLLPASMQSEDILGSRYVTQGDAEHLPDMIRSNYDRSLYEQTGTVFFAGNRLAGRQDSMRFINDNHDIIDEHMAFLRSVEARTSAGSIRDDELEQLRQRTAAALDERLHGGHVSSISDASVSDRMETNDYGGECATGVAVSAQEQMGLVQGKKSEMQWMTCPFCGLATYGDPCASRLVCNECAAEVRDGKVVSKGMGRGAALQNKRNRSTITQPSAERPPRVQKKTDTIQQVYGENAIIRREITIGGEHQYVVDKLSGEVIAQLN